MTGEAIRTRFEEYVEKLLLFLDIPFKIDHILCFECRQPFYWAKAEKPEMCLLGRHSMHKGEFCRPDVLILDKRSPMPTPNEKCRFSVLRIDGSIHNKRIQRAKDTGQERALKRAGIPFFVSLNEEWLDDNNKLQERNVDFARVPKRHFDSLISMFQQTIDPVLYEKYQRLRDVRASKKIP